MTTAELIIKINNYHAGIPDGMKVPGPTDRIERIAKILDELIGEVDEAKKKSTINTIVEYELFPGLEEALNEYWDKSFVVDGEYNDPTAAACPICGKVGTHMPDCDHEDN